MAKHFWYNTSLPIVAQFFPRPSAPSPTRGSRPADGVDATARQHSLNQGGRAAAAPTGSLSLASLSYSWSEVLSIAGDRSVAAFLACLFEQEESALVDEGSAVGDDDVAAGPHHIPAIDKMQRVEEVLGGFG